MNVTDEKTFEPPEWAEQRRVGARLKALVERLGMTQDEFADASGGHLERVDVNRAINGGRGKNPGNLARTAKWLHGIATAASVEEREAEDYVAGKIELDELIRRKERRERGASYVIPGFEDLGEVNEKVYDAAIFALKSEAARKGIREIATSRRGDALASETADSLYQQMKDAGARPEKRTPSKADIGDPRVQGRKRNR